MLEEKYDEPKNIENIKSSGALNAYLRGDSHRQWGGIART
jgi:hypothetical protein